MSDNYRQVALVSGGSRGIGAAIVQRLAADGWDVGFCYRDDEMAAIQAEKAAGELGARVLATEVDVRLPAEVTEWFARAEDELGPVEALVSCAGIARDQPLVLIPEAEWRTVIDTGLNGVFHLCRTAAAAMMRRRSGRIVTVSSACGEYDHAPAAHHTLTRPGVDGFVRSLATQAARFGVNVNAVTPGPAIRPRDVADLVAFALSPQAAGLTGRVLEVPAAILL